LDVLRECGLTLIKNGTAYVAHMHAVFHVYHSMLSRLSSRAAFHGDVFCRNQGQSMVLMSK